VLLVWWKRKASVGSAWYRGRGPQVGGLCYAMRSGSRDRKSLTLTTEQAKNSWLMSDLVNRGNSSAPTAMGPLAMLDVLSVSDMCVDLVLAGDVRPRFGQVEQIISDYVLELGGSANIFASQLTKLGGRVGLVGRTGQDALGGFCLKRLCTLGIDVSHVKMHSQRKTGLGVALAERDDRAILTYLGTIDATQPGDLSSDLLEISRHWHIASYFLLASLRGFWVEWAQRCKAARLTLSLDTNWDPENRWAGVMELLPVIDVFLPNQNEALAVAGEKDVLTAARRLAREGPLVVVKRGEEGAMAVLGNKTWDMPSRAMGLSPVKVVDTVGAGDNFDAGFIRGWLLRRDVRECLILGHRCAVASLTQPGGISGQLQESAT
jgi:sugar/nucleoside kinase (ribokinase family)